MDTENSTSPGDILNQNIFQGCSGEKYIFTHNLGPRHEKHGLCSTENIFGVTTVV